MRGLWIVVLLALSMGGIGVISAQEEGNPNAPSLFSGFAADSYVPMSTPAETVFNPETTRYALSADQSGQLIAAVTRVTAHLSPVRVALAGTSYVLVLHLHLQEVMFGSLLGLR